MVKTTGPKNEIAYFGKIYNIIFLLTQSEKSLPDIPKNKNKIKIKSYVIRDKCLVEQFH